MKLSKPPRTFLIGAMLLLCSCSDSGRFQITSGTQGSYVLDSKTGAVNQITSDGLKRLLPPEELEKLRPWKKIPLSVKSSTQTEESLKNASYTIETAWSDGKFAWFLTSPGLKYPSGKYDITFDFFNKSGTCIAQAETLLNPFSALDVTIPTEFNKWSMNTITGGQIALDADQYRQITSAAIYFSIQQKLKK